MKKVLSIALTLAFVLSIIGGSIAFAKAKVGAYKDGTYKAQYDVFDKYAGYKPMVTITVKGGNVASCVYDSISKTGTLKSKDASYEAQMKAKKGVGPVEYAQKLTASFMAKKDVNKVDSISGATEAVRDFKALVNAALANAKKGVKTTAIVKAPVK